MIDFERRRIRSKIEAALLASGDRNDSEVGRFRADAIGALRGSIIEIGPGTGVNLRHYDPSVDVVAIEPNPVMRERLAATASALGRSLEIRDLRGEEIDVPDGSADAVVGTLVLCGVDDPHRVVDEIRRVLRPGGAFVFVEHVAAPPDTRTARAQHLLRRPHEWMFNGCRVDQNTEQVLRSRAWSSLDVRSIDLGPLAAHVRHHIVGTAIR